MDSKEVVRQVNENNVQQGHFYTGWFIRSKHLKQFSLVSGRD